MQFLKKASKYIYILFLLSTLAIYIIAVTPLVILAPNYTIGLYLFILLVTVITFIVSTLSEVKSIEGSKTKLVKSILKNTAIIFCVNFALNNLLRGGSQGILYTFIFSLICGISVAIYVDRRK